MAGFDDKQLHHIIGCYCPEILYPYARQAVSNAVMQGGFPQLNLAPVNFEALYAQHMQQQAQAAEDGEAVTLN